MGLCPGSAVTSAPANLSVAAFTLAMALGIGVYERLAAPGPSGVGPRMSSPVQKPQTATTSE